ncbi:MAG: FprA family A-type flavoprotein, partial [Oscillospiraceae bacterium]|nr:FprA family A-type flavoprotein [Oscillospiraceae bacterium]
MHNVKKITEDLIYVGASDRRLALFENVYPIPNGISYNSYLLLDEQTVLFDTVDTSVAGVFFENIAYALQGRSLDCLVVNHMEPDHAGTMAELVLRYPDVKIITNAKVAAMIKRFFDFDIDARLIAVKEGDTYSTGKHDLTFVMAPMVHWPEVMVTYDLTDKILFSADAFGSFEALNGSIFADEVNVMAGGFVEERRYYTNIVGKYGMQVQALLKKAGGLEISMICPLHGYVWRENLGAFIEKYALWSSYTPEEKGVLIAYGSIYGNTENAANILASKLSDLGVKNVALYDVSETHPSYIIGEAFKLSHLVFASATYNNGIFVNMENLLHDLVAHNLQGRTIGIMENGSWAPVAGKLMKELLSGLKNTTILEETETVASAVKEETIPAIEAL